MTLTRRMGSPLDPVVDEHMGQFAIGGPLPARSSLTPPFQWLVVLVDTDCALCFT